MDIQEVEIKIKSYRNEVKDFHPFLKTFLPKMPHVNHVEYTHGNREYGSDFVLVKHDDTLLRESYIGIVVKSGRISQKNVDEIERQINESFRLPRTIFNGQKEIYLDTVWLITNDHITKNAKDKIKEYFKNKNVAIIDVEMLVNLVTKPAVLTIGQMSLTQYRSMS